MADYFRTGGTGVGKPNSALDEPATGGDETVASAASSWGILSDAARHLSCVC